MRLLPLLFALLALPPALPAAWAQEGGAVAEDSSAPEEGSAGPAGSGERSEEGRTGSEEAGANDDAGGAAAEGDGAGVEGDGAGVEEGGAAPAPAPPVDVEAAADLLAFDPAAAGDPLGTLTIRREERPIAVQQFAPSAEGGEFRLYVPGCEEGVRLSTIYAPAPYAVVTDVGEARIVSRAVLARRPPNEEGGQERETLEMFSGTLEVGEDFCPREVERVESAGVVIEQGRTVVVGRGLLYENASGVATMSGPVALERAPEGEGDVVTATADGLAFDLETDRSTLEGNVRVTAGERVSEADTLELDEEAGLATLRGNPARSTEGENVLEGNTLLYYLDSNDVIVEGGVRGTLEIDLD